MIFTLFPDYFSRQTTWRQARKERLCRQKRSDGRLGKRSRQSGGRLCHKGEKERRGKRPFQSAPLLLSYKKHYYSTKLFCRNPTWVAEILVSSILYGKVATIGCRIYPKLS